MPTQSLLQFLLDKKNGGSRTIAILHTTCRLTMCLISAYMSQWDVNFAGKWDSALKGNSALRARVASAAGFELADREGQYVIHFLWDMRKFNDSINAHLLVPQLVTAGYPIEILALGTLPHKSQRCPKWAMASATSSLVVPPAFWLAAPRAALGCRVKGLLFELVSITGVRDPSVGLRGAH